MHAKMQPSTQVLMREVPLLQVKWIGCRAHGDEDDPIHGKSLTHYLEEAAINFKDVTLDLHKRSLKSLRSIDEMKICSVPNDFSRAAIGAA